MKFCNSNLKLAGGNKGMSTGWTKSSFCTNSTCVEVSLDRIAITDSKNPSTDRPIIDIDPVTWNKFIDHVTPETKNFSEDDFTVQINDNGTATFSHDNKNLSFTQEEWNDFVKSATTGELKIIL